MKKVIAFSIWQKASAKSLAVKIIQTASGQLPLKQKGQAPTDQLVPIGIFQTPSEISSFTLNWVREQETGV